MHRNLDVGQLRTLVTIMRTGGFRRAAQALSLTQPAVSQHIRRLEAVLGGPVFASTGRTLELTDPGRELYHYACRLVALNDEAAGRIIAAERPTRIGIGVSPYLEGALPEFLAALVDLMPRIRPTVHTGLSTPLAARVAAGELDVALVLHPARNPAFRPVGAVRLAWYGSIPTAEPGSLPIALCAEPCSLRRHVLAALTAQDQPWHLAYEGPDVPGLRAAVAAGLGLTCLPAHGPDARTVPRLLPNALPSLPVPGSLPLALALAPTASAPLAEAATHAARQALRPYLTTDPAPTSAGPPRRARP
ncbi:LysR family transcriptional regulator [Streptomyces sp. NPDC057555]|uniref:LysR family transcriptional regulator n=1 Tax=Streptomyces sp. NPDC057555 TaxID=3346166 RepID=UPI00368F6E47